MYFKKLIHYILRCDSRKSIEQMKYTCQKTYEKDQEITKITNAYI